MRNDEIRFVFIKDNSYCKRKTYIYV